MAMSVGQLFQLIFSLFSLIAGRIILRLTVRATRVHNMINYQFDGFPIEIYIENVMSVVEHSVDIKWATSGVFTWNSFTKDNE